VVGVSADEPAVQQRFIEKFGLTFPMIPDPEKSIIGAYGALKVTGITAERTTFLIDPDGRIVRIWRKVKVDGHAEDVLEAIRAASVGDS